MSQIKSKKRVGDHGAVFTPHWMVEAMLDLVKGESERILTQRNWTYSAPPADAGRPKGRFAAGEQARGNRVGQGMALNP